MNSVFQTNLYANIIFRSYKVPLSRLNHLSSPARKDSYILDLRLTIPIKTKSFQQLIIIGTTFFIGLILDTLYHH